MALRQVIGFPRSFSPLTDSGRARRAGVTFRGSDGVAGSQVPRNITMKSGF